MPKNEANESKRTRRSSTKENVAKKPDPGNGKAGEQVTIAEADKTLGELSYKEAKKRYNERLAITRKHRDIVVLEIDNVRSESGDMMDLVSRLTKLESPTDKIFKSLGVDKAGDKVIASLGAFLGALSQAEEKLDRKEKELEATPPEEPKKPKSN